MKHKTKQIIKYMEDESGKTNLMIEAEKKRQNRTKLLQYTVNPFTCWSNSIVKIAYPLDLFLFINN
jgi:ribulose 1,5-bisphosphate carboxylase large subunit-like protein